MQRFPALTCRAFAFRPFGAGSIPSPWGVAIPRIFSRIPKPRGRSGERGYSNSIMTFPKPTGLGNENRFFALSINRPSIGAPGTANKVGRIGLQSLRRFSSDDSPEGMPGQTKPGEVTACSIQFRRDGFSAKGRDSEPPRLRIAPCFPVLAPWPES